MKTTKLFIALVTALLLGACGNQIVHYTLQVMSTMFSAVTMGMSLQTLFSLHMGTIF